MKCSQLLFSFSQFTVPVNQTNSSRADDQDVPGLLIANPAQFLVLQFSATVIVTNLQVNGNVTRLVVLVVC